MVMKIYKVGGAVRDKLLKRKVVDHDYVVVGATVEEMLTEGYTPVGKDFPVFLHPKTHPAQQSVTKHSSGRWPTRYAARWTRRSTSTLSSA